MQFESILQRMDWTSQPLDSILCLIMDEGSTEQLRWQLIAHTNQIVRSPENLTVMDLDSLESGGISSFTFKFIICYLADCNWSMLYRLKRLLLSSEVQHCAIVITQSESAIQLALDLSSESVQEAVSDTFFPAKVTLIFLPHSTICLANIDISNSSLLSYPLSLHVFASYRMRKLRPLTLSVIDGGQNNSSDYNTLYDLSAADLPLNIKSGLKLNAHGIAETLLYNLGVDVSSSIFAVGKTASLLGHSLLVNTFTNITDTLMKQEEEEPTSTFFIHLNKPKSRSTASLLVIDRLEDLFTPLSLTGEQPIMHRVINALKIPPPRPRGPESSTSSHHLNGDHQSKAIHYELDIPLRPNWHPESDIDTAAWMQFMSGVSSLSFPALPSICYDPHEEEKFVSYDSNSNSKKESNLLYELMTSSGEDGGRQVLINELKYRIQCEGGQLPPPKKRGLGAEILALVQSLIKSPGGSKSNPQVQQMMSMGEAGEWNLISALRSERLIALALAVVETMQRFSAKQFISLCPWRCAMEVRAAREMELLRALQTQPADALFVGLALALKPVMYRSKSLGNNPVDVVHCLMMVMGLLSLTRFESSADIGSQLSIVIADLATQLTDYFLGQAFEDELLALRRFGLLTGPLLELLLEARFDEEMAAEQRHTIQAELCRRLGVFREIACSYQHIVDKVSKKGPSSNSWMGVDALRQILMRPGKQGLIADLVAECVQYQHDQQSAGNRVGPAAMIWEHVQSPLQQMKKAGLGLLSKGLGSFGLMGKSAGGDNEPHPGQQETLVVCVLGGISYRELAQIRAVSEANGKNNKKVVVIATNVVSGEEVFASLFQPFEY